MQLDFKYRESPSRAVEWRQQEQEKIMDKHIGSRLITKANPLLIPLFVSQNVNTFPVSSVQRGEQRIVRFPTCVLPNLPVLQSFILTDGPVYLVTQLQIIKQYIFDAEIVRIILFIMATQNFEKMSSQQLQQGNTQELLLLTKLF